MRVLVHHPGPGQPPAGVWWLPYHQSLPRGEYLEPRHYRAGAMSIFGDSGGRVFTLAHWNAKVDQLSGSVSPLHSWTQHTTIKKPLDFLADLL